MNQSAFEKLRSPSWQGFELVIDESSKFSRKLSKIDAEGFLEEYKAINRDLALAQDRGYSADLIDYLNSLVSRGHNIVHIESRNWWSLLWQYVVSGFPREVRAAKNYVWVATGLFLVPAFVLIGLIQIDYSYLHSTLSAYALENLERQFDPENSSAQANRDSKSDFNMFGFYVFNNVSISLRVFGSGILFGIGTMLILILNGIYISAAFYHLVDVGYTDMLLTFVIAHGALELTGIVLSGAAGLMIGYSLLSPGHVPRIEALKTSARKGVQIMAGVMVMLLIAAFIEAYWSSNRAVPYVTKYVVGGVLWLGVISYFVLVGRRGD